jgi:hypothetical protein
VVKDLLRSLIARGLAADRAYLFVIDRAKALHAAIEELFGEHVPVQRCRTHKVRNVTERLPKSLAAQVKAVMHAAYTLDHKEGMAKLRQQAKWLQAEHPEAAASLLEGLEETFTVNRLGLPPSLRRCLAFTNVIENPNGAVRRTGRRVTRDCDADMAMRGAAAGYLEAEKRFRKIQGVRELWVLSAALGGMNSIWQCADKVRWRRTGLSGAGWLGVCKTVTPDPGHILCKTGPPRNKCNIRQLCHHRR